MWYLIVGLLGVLLIWRNSKGRDTSITKYAVLSIVLPWVGYSLWQAEKQLINDEKRYGGKAWNFLKTGALIHTFLCIIWGIYGVIGGAMMTDSAGSDAEAVGAAIGTGIGMLMIMAVWFGGVFGALVLGSILKTPTIEEASK